MAGKESEGILVFISNRESQCGECGQELGKHAWIRLNEAKGALCLTVRIWITWFSFLREMPR